MIWEFMNSNDTQMFCTCLKNYILYYNTTFFYFCSKKDIPVTNYRSHTLYCARNMVKCPDCDIMVAHGNENMELHRQEFHALRICDQCGVSIEAYKLPEHKVLSVSLFDNTPN